MTNRICICGCSESDHEPNGEIRKGSAPCTYCKRCKGFCHDGQSRLFSDAELTRLADAILRQYEWQHRQMALKEQKKIERMKKALYRRKHS